MPSLTRKNASATQRGESFDRKQYIAGTTYTNGTPTVTSSISTYSVIRATFVPYQTTDGSWRLSFNIAGSTSVATRVTYTLTLSGITFKTGSGVQAVSSVIGVNSAAAITGGAYTSAGTQTLFFEHASASTSSYYVSGDVELDSKPTWAD